MPSASFLCYDCSFVYHLAAETLQYGLIVGLVLQWRPLEDA